MANLPTLGSVARPKSWGYEASLDDLLLRLARSPDRPLTITSAPNQADRLQTEQTSEDFLPESGQVFSRNNFTGGSGLDFAHRADADELDPIRYWDSKGIDISVNTAGQLDSIRLLHQTELVFASTSANLHMARLADESLLYAEGSIVWHLPFPNQAAPSRNSEDPNPGTQNIEGLTVLGDEVYAACGTDGVSRRSSVGLWSKLLSSPSSFGVWSTKGRIISDDGAGAIHEITLATGQPILLVNQDSGHNVTAVVDAGPVILVASTDGHLYSFAADTAGSLELVAQFQLTNTDIPVTMAWALGVLMVGTRDGSQGRMWSAEIGDQEQSYTITNAQLLREFPYIPSTSLAARDVIYMAVRESASEAAIYRLQLATSGFARDLVFAAPTAGDIVSLRRSGDAIFATVGNSGLLRQDNLYVPSGYVISPMADFFSPNLKTWVGVTVQAEGLDNGTELDIYVATDPQALLDPNSSLWRLMGRLTVQSQIGQELTLPNVKGRYCAVQLKMFATSDQTNTPSFTSFALRSYSDTDEVIVTLPVNVSDWIEIPHRRPFRSPGWGRRVLDALLGFDGAYVTLELFRPPMVIRGVVEGIQTPLIARGSRGSSTLFTVVQIRGKIIESSSGLAGQGSLGIARLGRQLLGA